MMRPQSELGRKRNYFLPLECILLLLVSDGLCCYTVLNPLCACLHVRPIPRNVIVVCLLPAL